MVNVRRADASDRKEVEKLIAEYHVSEGLTPKHVRIGWAVDQQLSGLSPGLLIVAEDKRIIVGVALGVFTPSAELGRVLTVNDFFVKPAYRRRGVGKSLATRVVDECNQLDVDEINLEVLNENNVAALFWRAIGFLRADRSLYKMKLRRS